MNERTSNRPSPADRADTIIDRAATTAREFAQRIGATGTDHVYHVGWLESEIQGLCSELAGYANPARGTPACWRHCDVGVLYGEDEFGIRITHVYLRGIDISDGMPDDEVADLEDQINDYLIAAARAAIGPEIEHARSIEQRHELLDTQAISDLMADIRSAWGQHGDMR